MDYISEAVNTVKCSWWGAKISPETCRADWVKINKPTCKLSCLQISGASTTQTKFPDRSSNLTSHVCNKHHRLFVSVKILNTVKLRRIVLELWLHFTILCFVDLASLYNLVNKTKSGVLSLLECLFYYSPHVSGSYVPIIRRSNYLCDIYTEYVELIHLLLLMMGT